MIARKLEKRGRPRTLETARLENALRDASKKGFPKGSLESIRQNFQRQGFKVSRQHVSQVLKRMRKEMPAEILQKPVPQTRLDSEEARIRRALYYGPDAGLGSLGRIAENQTINYNTLAGTKARMKKEGTLPKGKFESVQRIRKLLIKRGLPGRRARPGELIEIAKMVGLGQTPSGLSHKITALRKKAGRKNSN